MSKAIEENRDPGHEDRHWALKLLILVLNLVFLLASIAALLVAGRDIVLDNNTLIDWFETHLSALILLIAVTAFFSYHKWLDKYVPLFTFIAVVFAAYAVFSASHDAENQRFSSAWTLVNSSTYTAPSVNVGQTNGGGRKEALAYLRDHHQSLQGADLSQAILSYSALDGMDLNRTTMIYTDLFGSDLRAASLWSGIMTDAQLQFSSLQGADPHAANLPRCPPRTAGPRRVL